VKAFDRRMVLEAGLLALPLPAGPASARDSRRPLLRRREVPSAAEREAPGNAAALG
jgi:hypothetical protein